MTFEPLQKLALLSPRRPDTGPQGFPVNKAAAEAGVVAAALSPDYRLEVVGNTFATRSFSLEELHSFDLHDAELPIACVEGWSASVRWRGVRLRDLLDVVGAPETATSRCGRWKATGSTRSRM